MDEHDWNERYRDAAAGRDSVWSLEPNVWVVENLSDLTPGTAVDLAAGEGRNALWLAQRGWEVTAVDFAAAGLAVGSGRAEQLGLEVFWQKADATTWRTREPVDLVLIAYLQLPAEQLAAALANAAAALAPGGVLAVVNHDRDNVIRGVGGPQDAAVLTTAEQLRQAVPGLEIVDSGQYERDTPKGTAIDAVLLARRPLAADIVD